MEWTFALPRDATTKCRLEKSFWLGRLQLSMRGQAAPRSSDKGKPFLVRTSDGATAKVYVTSKGWDYLPQVKVDAEPVVLGKPLSGWEYVFGGLPFMLIVLGGALGGFSGAVGTMVNYRVLRANQPTPLKAACVLGVTGLTFAAYLVLAGLLRALIGK